VYVGRMRLGTLLALLVLTTLIPLGLFAGLMIGRLWHQQRAVVERQNVETARAISLAIDQEVEVGRSALQVASTLELFDAPDAGRLALLSQRLLPTQASWRAIVLANADGSILFDSVGRGPAAAGFDGGGWIRSVVATKRPAVSNLFHEAVVGEHFFIISAPVMDHLGTVRFVLAAQVRASSLSDILQRQSAPAGGVVSLVDRKPRLMARSRNVEQYIGREPSPNFLEATRRMREGSFEGRLLEGMPSYSSMSRSQLTGWTVGVGLPASAIDTPIWRTITELALVVAILLAFGIGSALILGRALVGALTSASSAARGLARGEAIEARHSHIREAEELSQGLLDAAAILDMRLQERDQALLAEYAARREAEALSRSKDEFVATMSHELRTPLNAIYGWVKLLRMGKLDEERREHALEVIERNTRAQTQLIEDLLDMSRIVTGKLRLEMRRVDLAAVLQGAVEGMKPSAAAREVEIALDLQPGVDPISGDPDRLRQIVLNLVTNSLKFTSKGGHVEVKLRAEGHEAVVTVSDDGSGISPELLPHIFERFRQGASSPARKHGGLGIGLALVRHLVELHGGSVSAASPGENHGACFTLRFPLLAPRTFAGEAVATELTSGRDIADTQPLLRLNVLVVDDNDDARELVATTLRHAGAQVAAAASVTAAMESLYRVTPDIVISDIAMPNGTGYDLVRQLRTRSQTATVPAIALTAYTRPEDRVRAIDAGFSAHIGKPVDPATLVRSVAIAVGRG
jgi:signal transduction histidine kinase